MPLLSSRASHLTRRAGATLVVKMARFKFGLTLVRLSNASKLTPVLLLVSRLRKARSSPEERISASVLCLHQAETLS